MIDIFMPYMPFITFLITIIVNLFLVFKGANWFSYIVINVILIIVFTRFGITPFDFITDVVDQLVNIVKAIFRSIGEAIGDLLPW